MQKEKVKVKLLHPDAKMPIYATEGSAGADVYSIEHVEISPGEVKMIPTGLGFEVPDGYHMQIWDRSGFGKKGIHHFAGIIDSDYRGELKILLFNSTQEKFVIEKGDRMVQFLILPVIQADFEQVDILNETQRGEGGFQSTGVK